MVSVALPNPLLHIPSLSPRKLWTIPADRKIDQAFSLAHHLLTEFYGLGTHPTEASSSHYFIENKIAYKLNPKTIPTTKSSKLWRKWN
jgi:hypothetical protein